MDRISKIEREQFDCPEIDCNDYITYPLVSEAEYEFMKFYVVNDLHTPNLLFTFFRELREICFVDVYVYNTKAKSYTRYIIRDGYRLKYKEEKSFITHLHNGVDMIRGQIIRAYFLAKFTFPQWSLSQCSENEPDLCLLEKMYFSSHRAGAREILYKAGLCRLAKDLDEYHYINLNGTNPEKIFGNGMSLRMLRVLNNLRLSQAQDLDKFKEIYTKFSDYFDKELPNSLQWDYLTELTQEPGIIPDNLFSFYKQGFKRQIYNWLKNRFEGLNEIREYYMFIEKHPEFKRREIPENIHKELRDISFVIEDKYRDELLRRWKEEHTKYEYSDNKYEIVMPQKAMDFYKERLEQKNCVMNYVESHSTSGTTILFLRNKTNLDHSFVTLEIKDGTIHQALACCNKMPPKEVYEFLIDYANKKDFAIYHSMTEEIMNTLKLQRIFWKTTAPGQFENEFPDGLF